VAQVLARAAGGACAGCAVLITLREAGPSAAAFTGQLRTAANASAAAGGGGAQALLLLPSPDAAVEVVYSDAAPLGVVVGRFEPCARGAVSLSPALSVAAGAGAVLTVTVVDSDLNRDPTVREWAAAAVASGADRAAVQLREAG
jgi:hypothetical protein